MHQPAVMEDMTPCNPTRFIQGPPLKVTHLLWVATNTRNRSFQSSSIKICHGRAKPRAVRSRGGWLPFHSHLKSNLTEVTDVIPRQAVAAWSLTQIQSTPVCVHLFHSWDCNNLYLSASNKIQICEYSLIYFLCKHFSWLIAEVLMQVFKKLNVWLSPQRIINADCNKW